jgi:aspartyl-tRNA(Asn)/glutamyl-tRNA(Gln) amidotransferase subunit A
MNTEEFSKISISELVDRVTTGAVSVEEITAASLDRARDVDRRTHCFVEIEEESAMETARALDARLARGKPAPPLAGVPLAHKDMYCRRHQPRGAGSPIFSDFRPDFTATPLARLEQAGTITIGRLQTAEFTVSPTGFNVHFPPVCNPWNPAYVPGGSSSGSAVAVSTGAIPASMGSDAGGSIRHPAAMSGVAGLKPTYGRISRHGLFPLAPSLDHAAILARTARDIALLLGVVAGRDREDPSSSARAVPDYTANLVGNLAGIRFGIPDGYYFDGLPDEIAERLFAALEVLKESGAQCRNVGVIDMHEISKLGRTVFGFEAFRAHGRWIDERPEAISALVRARIEAGRTVSEAEYRHAMAGRTQMRDAFIATSLHEVDLLFTPCVPVHTPTIEEAMAASVSESLETVDRITRCTRALNYLTLPAVAVPCGFVESGLPVAFQLVARPFREGMLLRAADAYQQNTGWHRRYPMLSAGDQPGAPSVERIEIKESRP